VKRINAGARCRQPKLTGREPERTCQLAAPLGELVAAVLRLLQDPASPRQECMPVLGQRHLAGGSLGEPPAQLALELDEAFTNN
jgi:hypothetical protein